MMGSWKKAENENGFLYYINEKTNIKQWDHPKFTEIDQAIDECNYVSYPAYRLASKFRVLQRSLHMDEVPLSIVTGVFERHRLGNNESSLTLETCDLEAVLSDIFFAANKKNHTSINIDYATELMLTFLYNVFDSFRERNIKVFSSKMILSILSNSTWLDLYKFLFSLCADHNNCVTRLRLQGMLLKILDIIKYLHEDVSFGHKVVNASVENCFQNSPGLVGIMESSFVCWLENESHFLSWLQLLFKIKSAETVTHFVKCSTCKTRPFMGLRYRCVKCSRYTQCQRCFLVGRTSHSHKLSHPVREFCGNSKIVSKEHSGEFVKKVCSLFCSRSMDTNNASIVRPTSCLKQECLKPYPSIDALWDIEPLSSPHAQLQTVIRQLESQNRELQQMIILENYSHRDMKKYLEEYRIYMANNIKKLKILKNNISTSAACLESNSKKPTNIQAIQMVQYNNIDKCKNMHLDKMNPISEQNKVGHSFTKTDIDEVIKSGFNKSDLQKCSKSQLNCHNGSWNEEHYNHKFEPSNHYLENNIYISKSPVKLLHNDLDEALAKLQQILANNFSLEDSLSPMDNTNLKFAVTEVEGMLTSIIDNVESSRSSSTQPGRVKT